MARNVILIIATLGILGLMFAGYAYITAIDAQSRAVAAREAAVARLPEPTVSSDESIQLGPVDVPPGEEFSFVVYDERTGRPTDRFRCKQWRKVPGEDNEVLVTEPELIMLLPSGMIATITADTGRITVDRIDTRRMRPRLGWLSGNARIQIDRETAEDRTPPAERPEDLILIESDTFAFDLEIGKLELDGRLTVSADEFQIAGRGLELVWNQINNRVERLLIREGEQMTISLAGGVPVGLAREDQAGTGVAPAPQSQPFDPRHAAAGRAGARTARQTTYRLALAGGVTAEHFRGDSRIGALSADRLKLLFDVGGGLREAGAAPATQPGDDAPPQTQPAQDASERLVIRWSGPLALDPEESTPHGGPPRRRLEAVGDLVTLEVPDGVVHCGGLRYEEETQRAWLRPLADGRVNIELDGRLHLDTAGVYIDRGAGLVKLIGDVRLRSQRPGRDALAITCSLWAELHLAAAEKKPRETPGLAPDNLIDTAKLESAVFVGDVRVHMADRRLTAHRLETTFRAPQGDEGLDELLDSAIASGGVVLAARRAAGGMPFWMARLDDRVRDLLDPSSDRAELLAPGEHQALACTWARLDFDRNESGQVYVSRMDADGAVRLVDRSLPVAARGRTLTAAVGDDEQIASATVRGTPQQPAALHAAPYTVTGTVVTFDQRAQTMQVDGRSRLSFESDRGLRGEPTYDSRRVVIDSRDRLLIDAAGNNIQFVGEVVARSAGERLLADVLTLHLRDVPSQPESPSPISAMRSAFERARGAEPEKRPAPAASDRVSRGRKEPVRLVARNGVIESDTLRPGEPQPLVHQSIAAPELNVDIPSRVLRSVGETTLLMISRQLDFDADAAREATGLPSALMSRGPSQTAMKCDRSMTYQLGADGPGRRDSVLFEGGVTFRHVAGRRIIGLEEMLPEVKANPQLLAQLKDRNTYLDCDRLEGAFVASDATRGPAGRGDMRLVALNATGNVYLRDEHGPGIREVHAHQVEFDRGSGRIRVLGDPASGRNANIYYQNVQTGTFDAPAAGPEFVLDLNTNTVTAGAVTGEFRRP